MIRYHLICDKAHAFQSWFPDSAAYDVQAKRGLVACPDCGSVKVAKAIMAPSIARKDRLGSSEPKVETPRPGQDQAEQQPVALIDERQRMVAAMLREVHAKIIQNTDDVGSKFPDQARRMHDGEIPARSIRGEATMDEARALLEDGIEILSIPRLPDSWN